MEILLPKGRPRPKGYSNGITAKGRLVFVSGQVGWNEREEFESDGMLPQVRRALENTVAVLREGGAETNHVVRMTRFITDKRAYVKNAKAIGAAYRALFGKHYPAMALVEVKSLLEDRAKVEIETTAVVPEDA